MKRKNKKRFQRIKSVYSECFREIKLLKKYIFIIICLFLVSAIFGYLFPNLFSDFFLKTITEILEKISGMSFFPLFLFIFRNNLLICFFALIAGILLGVIPLIYTMLNGVMLGFVSNMAVEQESLSSLLKILPHGIFELPAVFIAFSFGLKNGYDLLSNFLEPKSNKKKGIVTSFKKSLKLFLFVILPLIFIGALIESFFMVYFL